MSALVLPWKTSVTVAALAWRDGRLLLVEEDTPEGVRINQPAGHLERDESVRAACVRETLEETAYAFTPTHLLGVYLSRYRSGAADVTYVRLAFTGELGAHHPARALDTEIRRVLWLTPDEIRACRARHRSPLVMQCVDDFLTGRRLPLELVFEHPSVLDAR